jgi:hypothetical protein
VNVVRVEPGPNAPIPTAIDVAEALGIATRDATKTNADEIQNCAVLIVSSSG